MNGTHRLFVSLLGSLMLVVIGCGGGELDNAPVSQEQDDNQVPIFEVDPLWPKPLPNNWVTGGVVGVAVDKDENIWIAHRSTFIAANDRSADNGVSSICCVSAPPILVFNQAGDLIKSWGPQREASGSAGAIASGDVEVVPGWEQWAQSEHGLTIDYKGFLWTGGNGQKDSRVLKFTLDGEFVMAIGNYAPYGTDGPGHDGGPSSDDTENLNKPTKAWVDPATDEVYISDGYGNRRVVVFDADTGEYKRHWGAYGGVPDDDDPYNATRGGVDETYDPEIASKQFGRATHGITVSLDSIVYLADRTNNRVQSFSADGTFLKEVFIDRHSRGFGSAFDVALSSDPEQRFLYVADGMNSRVVVVRRDTMEVVSRFGHGGPYPGGMYAVHSLATDSQGNLYTGETLHGRRVQRWIYKGLGPMGDTGE